MKFRHIPFILLAVIIILLMTASFVEKSTGTTLYSRWWFIVLWALLAGSAAVLLCRTRLYRRPATFMLHGAFLFILAGAFVTHIAGVQGVAHLRLDTPQEQYYNSETEAEERFPFSILLKDFQIENYPGTSSPMDYQSVVQVVENGQTAATLTISMNNIGEYGGYRFYQSAFDDDRQGTVLSVSHDPWGIGITYTGYGLLFLAMLLLLVLPHEGFRRLYKEKAREEDTGQKEVQRKRGAMAANRQLLMAVALLSPLSSLLPAQPLHAAPKVLPKEVAAQFGDLYAYYNGRICPLQTIAKDFTVKLYGKASYQGLTAEQVLTGWMLYPTNWIEEPIIKIKADVASIIGIDSRYATYRQFHGAEGYKLEPYLAQSSPATRSIHEADEKLNILLMLFNGQLVKLYPYQEGLQLHWYSQDDRMPKDMPQDKWLFITKSMDYIGELAWKKDYGEMGNVLQKIRHYQQKEAGNMLPSEQLFRAEKLYNQADYTRPLAMLLITTGLLAFFFYLAKWLRGEDKKAPLVAVWVALLIISIVYQLFIISLRGYVSGHLPLSNGHETMQFMSLCALLFTLFCHRRYPLAMPFGLLLGGLCMLVAMMGESNPQITLLMPVLASPLLSIHVCVIMVAYVLLGFTMLNGIAALLLHRHHQHVAQLTHISQLMLFPATFFLAAGIFIGAIWANQSWGNYWSWDPKETWALITMLVYAMPLHRTSLPWLRRPMLFHLYMVLAFLTILMTYFGVNFFLGGMHSYA